MQKKIDHKHQDFLGESVEEQAAFWVYRLQDKDCSPRDEAAFVQWHSEPNHQQAFALEKARYKQLQGLRKLLSASDEKDEPANVKAGEAAALGQDRANSSNTSTFKNIAQRVEINKKRRFMIASAASFAAAASVLLALFLIPREDGLHNTALGEIANFALDDGSIIVLDTASSLQVDYSDTERRVILQNGRAFFNVEKDPSRPFVVKAGEQSVRVVGTEFSVQYSESTHRISLKEGKVEVDTGIKTQNVSLNPGQSYESKAGSTSRVVDIASAEEEFAWVNGVLYFEATSMLDVVASINRYSEKKLILSSEALKQKRISGRYTVGELDSFLSMLRSMFDFSLHYDEEGNVTIGDASN